MTTGESQQPRLLVATHNQGKLREFRTLLDGLGYDIVGLGDLGITEEASETGATFAENAEQKARFYHDLTGLPAVADDSGLVVDALGGEPGVISARYGGAGLDDRGRVDLVLQRLQGVPTERRTARFVAVLVLVTPTTVQQFEGTVEGRIAAAPAGSGGFGYDPIFYLPDRHLTMARLPPEQKNAISHRARAAAKLRAYLSEPECGSRPDGA